MVNDGRRTWIVLIGLALGWLTLHLTVPSLLASAYRGEAPGFLNALVTKQDTHSLQDYQDQWNRVSWGLLVLTLAALLPLGFTRIWDRLAAAVDRGRARWNPLILHALVATLAGGFVMVAWTRWPVVYVHLVSEDYWAEHLSFLAWFLCAVLLAIGALRHRELRRPGFVLLGLASFFIAMEEISWGQNLLSFPTPEFFQTHNIQGETNVHNLVENQIKYKLLGQLIVVYVLLAGPIVRLIAALGRFARWFGIPVIPGRLWPYFLVTSAFLMFDPVVKSDEVAETLLAVSILALALDLTLGARQAEAPRRFSAGFLTTLTIVYLVGLSMAVVSLFTMPESADWRLRDFALEHYPAQAMPAQAAILLDYVNADPRRATVRTRVAQARRDLAEGRAEAARTQLQAADSLVPERVEGWLDLAEAWVAAGDCPRALAVLGRAAGSVSGQAELEDRVADLAEACDP